jgi:hypothetical protein
MDTKRLLLFIIVVFCTVGAKAEQEWCGNNLPVWQATGGDVNKDGTIDKKDVELTSKYIMGKNPANFFKDAADMDGKGGVNVADLVLLIDKMKMNQ